VTRREFLLPDLGEGLEEAEILAWRVAAGDRVELNQPLVEVNTAKAVVEIPSPFEGVVAEIHGGEGEVVQVGSVLVTFEIDGGAEEATGGGGAAAEPDGEAKPKRTPLLVGYGVVEDEPHSDVVSRKEGGAVRERVAASPPVRRLAKELGVDLGSVSGSGPNGRVTREDVEREASSPAGSSESEVEPRGGAVDRVPVRGTRRLIAEKMTRSVREIPHVTTFLTLDAFWLERFREELGSGSDQRVTALPIIVRALAEACREHPELNASFDSEAGEIALYRDCHVGVAVDTERGLTVPVIRDAGRRGILEIAAEIARLAGAARDGTVRPEELTGGTITVSNVGAFGAEFGTPIINYPESAILAPGVIEPRALVVDGEVAVRPAMTLSLSFDHRLLDGAAAGRALRAVADLLESPFALGSLPR
jgi:pyruvate dehydrogenase E2 component (dihydrolipoamide acetyltransferase)